MAQRDQSQGFGFVYVEIKKLLEQRHTLSEGDLSYTSPETAQTVNFNKDSSKRPAATTSHETLQAPKAAVAPPESTPDAIRERSNAIQQIRTNLDRLQSLHHKLHAMLAELNTISDSKKKR